MDFFASDIFLTAVAKDFYGAKHYRFKTYGINGHSVRLVEVNGRRPIVSGPFYDFVKPLTSEEMPDEALGFIPKIVTSTVQLDEDTPSDATKATSQDPAPLIIWKEFPTWEDYEALLHRRSKALLSNVRKRRTKLQREHGETTYRFDDHNSAAFDLLCAWKKGQYEGGNETLENPRAVAMLRSLFNDGHLILSTLKAGDRYVSIKAGFVWERHYLSLMPAYDPEFAKYGIGKDLLLRTLEHSYRTGDKYFDFLQGAEPYKFDYATHLQIIDSLGKPPISHEIRTRTERAVKAALMRLGPTTFYRVKRGILATRRFRQFLNWSR
ncbi:GNAT family N-acetyltransferase [Pseudarthrobacter sp. TAF60_1]|uniref:GNAT family N-acetyltransferase n=1 Tax=Pseudarthrobacter sp. TAF60_1 TaxID=3233071 RepID=UPI003F98CF65